MSITDRLESSLPKAVRAKIRTRRQRKLVSVVLGDYREAPGDVFLASYPRSGNTWVRYMLSMAHPSAPESLDSIHDVIPNIDQRPDLNRVPQPRLIKTHLPFDRRIPRAIYLLRDGRDATHSYWRFCKKEHGYGETFDQFLKRTPYFPWKWHEHVATWLHPSLPVLFVRYEQLLADPEKALECMIEFLGWSFDSSKIKSIVEESTRDSMKKKEEKGMFLAHVGKGVSGSWKETYTEKQLERFMGEAAPMLRRAGHID